ncbi:hypothetical protein [Acidicapsa ligni]|uniref:hypothetical protein n=1 Tax=Acidicapsa ligni TaxID=542300 RepID=UPI0037C0F0BB
MGQSGLNIFCYTLHTMALGQRFYFFLIASHQNWVGDDTISVREQHTTLIFNSQYGTNQMLVVTHSPGDAMHDDANAPACQVPFHLSSVSNCSFKSMHA